MKCLRFFLAAILCSTDAVAEGLNDIYLLAMENDYRYKVAESNYLALNEAKHIGRSLLLPSMVVEGSMGNRETESERRLHNPFATNNELTTGVISQSYTVALSQPIIDFSAFYEYKKGAQTAKRAVLNWQQAKQSLIVRTTTEYLKTLKANAAFKAALAAEKAYKAQLKSVQLAYDTGLVSISDLKQVKSAYDSSTAERIVSENNVRIQFYELMKITGKSHEIINGFKSEFTVENPTPAVLDKWVEMAVDQNLDINIAKIVELEAKYNYKKMKSEHLPTLKGRLGYSYSEDENSFSNDDPYDIETNDYSASITLTIPVFSGGGISSARRQAKYQYFEQRDTHKLVLRDVVQETRSSYFNTIAGVANVNARKIALDSSLSALNSSEAGYKEGVLSIVDLLEIQRTYYNAQRLYSAAIYDYLISGIMLKRVSGSISVKDIHYVELYLTELNPIEKPS